MTETTSVPYLKSENRIIPYCLCSFFPRTRSAPGNGRRRTGIVYRSEQDTATISTATETDAGKESYTCTLSPLFPRSNINGSRIIDGQIILISLLALIITNISSIITQLSSEHIFQTNTNTINTTTSTPAAKAAAASTQQPQNYSAKKPSAACRRLVNWRQDVTDE